MKNRVIVKGTHIFVCLVNGVQGSGQAGLLLKWHEGLDLAEAIIESCDQARKNAEENKLIPHDRKNQ